MSASNRFTIIYIYTKFKRPQKKVLSYPLKRGSTFRFKRLQKRSCFLVHFQTDSTFMSIKEQKNTLLSSHLIIVLFKQIQCPVMKERKKKKKEKREKIEMTLNVSVFFYEKASPNKAEVYLGGGFRGSSHPPPPFFLHDPRIQLSVSNIAIKPRESVVCRRARYRFQERLIGSRIC